ncbi:MAG: TIGR04141 family sporadically distributed protein [Synergistes sp.]|nr:TIGR04141 family sporadically distributed protein [Synergistes sp.]
MGKKNKLSIYLVKDEYANEDCKILSSFAQLLKVYPEVGTLYYLPSSISVPGWIESFVCGSLRDTNIFTSNARVVLLCHVSVAEGLSKTFAITMGYGKNLLAEDVIEEGFGLKVVLNTITPNSLRRINKTNIGGNQKNSNEQLPLESDIDAFGFDIDRDMIGTVTGTSDDETFAKGMITGSDMLNLSAEANINNIPSFLKNVYAQYTSKAYKESFGWIDHIRRVKDKKTIEELDAAVITLINTGSPDAWMAVPEVVDWENIEGFRYAGREIYHDIDISIVHKSFRAGLSSIRQLKDKRIVAIRSDNGEVITSWNAYRCLYAEVNLRSKSYCINNGRWYVIDQDFVETVNREYNAIPLSERSFLPYRHDHTRESDYSQEYVATDPSNLLLMDAKSIQYGGGQSKVELCDILTSDQTYIHIKPYSSSATLSHLFNQAVVSAELVLSDPEFRAKANAKIMELTKNRAFIIKNTQEKEITVILAILSDFTEDYPPIPFFSKIAMRYAQRRLQAFGCKVYLKNIKRI